MKSLYSRAAFGKEPLTCLSGPHTLGNCGQMSNSKTAEFKLVHINIYVNFVNICLGDFS